GDRRWGDYCKLNADEMAGTLTAGREAATRLLAPDRPLRLALYLLIVGTLFFARNFSQLHVEIGPLPLYVTEAFLLLWLLLRANKIKSLLSELPRGVSIGLTGFALVGALTLARSFVQGGSLETILRDSALFYYALFALVAAALLDACSAQAGLLKLCELSAFIISGIGVTNLLFRLDLVLTTSGSFRAI